MVSGCEFTVGCVDGNKELLLFLFCDSKNKLMICNNDISIRTAAQRIAFSAKSDQAADQIGEIVWLRRIETRP